MVEWYNIGLKKMYLFSFFNVINLVWDFIN